MALTAANKYEGDLKGIWFSEQYLGFACSLKAKKVLHQERSKYQDILIYERFILLTLHTYVIN